MLKKLAHVVAPLAVATALARTALAGSGEVDSLEIEGTSRVEDLEAFTTLVATVADFAEDWLFPMGAIILLGLVAVKMYQRDYMQAAVSLLGAIILAGIPYFMETLQVFST